MEPHRDRLNPGRGSAIVLSVSLALPGFRLVRMASLALSGVVAIATSAAATEPPAPGNASKPGNAGAPTAAAKTPADDGAELAVLGLAAPEAYEHAEALSRAIRTVLAQSRQWNPATGDYSLEVLTAALGCPERPDLMCLRRIALKTKLKQFLWGVLDQRRGRVSVQLAWFSDGKNRAETRFDYAATLTDTLDSDLLVVADRALSQLLGPLHYPVEVRSHHANGQLLIDGVPAGELHEGHASLWTTAGDHRFTLRVPSEAPLGTAVRVQIPHVTRVRLDAHVLPEPGAAAGSGDLPPSGPRSNQESSDNTLAWVTLGAGAAMLGAGAWSASEVSKINSDAGFTAYRAGVPRGEDACDAAARHHVVPGGTVPEDVVRLCNRGHSLQIAEFILLGLGAAASGTSLYLFSSNSGDTNSAYGKATLRAGRSSLLALWGMDF